MEPVLAETQQPREFTLTLDGKPKGMHRPRATTRGLSRKAISAGAARVHNADEDTQAMNDIGNVWLEAGSPRVTGPVALQIVVEHRRPNSHYGTGRNAGVLKGTAPAHCTVKPDLDNVAKLIMDGLNGRAWRDDVDVVSLIVRRCWSEDGWERTRVWVGEVRP